MKRQFLPYYASRAVLSLIFAMLVLGFTWKAGVLAACFFALFLVYLHSGWFEVDPGRPWFPLRRDERGREIQRQALIAALVSGVVIFVLLTALPVIGPLPLPAGPLAVALSALVYFGVQFALFAKS
jgi:sterol desaturase/sphingolipid hydroxylase (fatty acid hydroxylase superfamily)